MSTVRVRKPNVGEGWVVTLPESGVTLALKHNESYDSDDPVVRAFPWAFEIDNVGEVEQATAGPGERRNVRR